MGKNAAAKSFGKNSINYALFEILAEYKRCGLPRADILKAIFAINPFFAVIEFIRRKKTARKDIEKCMQVAKRIGLKQTGGTNEFPIFEK